MMTDALDTVFSKLSRVGTRGGGPSMWNCSTSNTACGCADTSALEMPLTSNRDAHSDGNPFNPVDDAGSTCTCTLCLTSNGRLMEMLGVAFVPLLLLPCNSLLCTRGWAVHGGQT